MTLLSAWYRSSVDADVRLKEGEGEDDEELDMKDPLDEEDAVVDPIEEDGELVVPLKVIGPKVVLHTMPESSAVKSTREGGMLGDWDGWSAHSIARISALCSVIHTIS